MFQSFKYSNLSLRFALAAVFLWFGIDKFFHPEYWLNAWIPQSISSAWEGTGMRSLDLVYVLAVFEILVGVSMITNIFVTLFSFLAVCFLISIFFFYGFNEVIIRDIGLIGGFLSLIFWPRQRF